MTLHIENLKRNTNLEVGDSSKKVNDCSKLDDTNNAVGSGKYNKVAWLSISHTTVCMQGLLFIVLKILLMPCVCKLCINTTESKGNYKKYLKCMLQSIEEFKIIYKVIGGKQLQNHLAEATKYVPITYHRMALSWICQTK